MLDAVQIEETCHSICEHVLIEKKYQRKLMIESWKVVLKECIFIKNCGVLFEGRATRAQKTHQIGRNGLCILTLCCYLIQFWNRFG